MFDFHSTSTVSEDENGTLSRRRARSAPSSSFRSRQLVQRFDFSEHRASTAPANGRRRRANKLE